VERQFAAAVSRAGLEGARRPHAGSSGLDTIEAAVGQLSSHEHLVVVIDDAHYVGDASWWIGLLGLLRRLRQLHVVVCSFGRHLIADLAAGRVDRREIGPDDLVLTVDELHELARSRGRTLTEA